MTRRVVEKLCTKKVCVDFLAPILVCVCAVSLLAMCNFKKFSCWRELEDMFPFAFHVNVHVLLLLCACVCVMVWLDYECKLL